MWEPEFKKFVNCVATYLADDEASRFNAYRQRIGRALDDIGNKAPAGTKGRTIALFVIAAEAVSGVIWDKDNDKSLEQYAEFGRKLAREKGDKTLTKAVHFLLMKMCDTETACLTVDQVLHGKDDTGQVREFSVVHEWTPKRSFSQSEVSKIAVQENVLSTSNGPIINSTLDDATDVEPNTSELRREIQNANASFVRISDASLTQVSDPLREFQVFVKLRAMELNGEIGDQNLLLGLYELYCRVDVDGCVLTKRFNAFVDSFPTWVDDLPDESWWFYGPRSDRLGWLKGTLLDHPLFRGEKIPPEKATAVITVFAKRRDFDICLSDGKGFKGRNKNSAVDAMISAFVLKSELGNADEIELCQVDMEL